MRIRNDGSDVWAIRADDPDKQVAGRAWTTEVVVGVANSQSPQFSLRLLVGTGEAELDIEPHTPGLVQQVAECCGLWRGPYQVEAEPWAISSDEDVEQLVEMLVDPRRKLPVFVLTVAEDAKNPDQPFLDAKALARATLGTGRVAILPALFTWKLTHQLGKLRSVFGGAIRAYLPGFNRDSNPYAHRLVLVDQLSAPDGLAQCARWMQWMAATESIRGAALGKDVLTFASIRNASLEIRQQQLKKEGASETEQLAAANARIKALEIQIEDQKATLDYFGSEHQTAEERAEAAEEQLRASAFRIQQLISQIEGDQPKRTVETELPETWSEFSNWCDVQLVGRVTLTPAARRGVRSPEFEDVPLVARSLLWLANDCRNRRLTGGEGSLREEAIEGGVRNAHCGADQFDLDWQGQRYTADWHIKNGGNTRDPRRCLRIYYFWHPPTQQIVIAEMPAHRRTGAS